MRKGQKTTQAKPGDTVIAYINDSASFVGIAVPHGIYSETSYTMFQDSPEEFVTCLVLGWFTNSWAIPNEDVHGNRKMHPFPSFHVAEAKYTRPYEFSKEIALCKHQIEKDNGVARFFFPKNSRALLQIHTAQHLMNGGELEGRPSWHFWSPRDEFYYVWVVLHAIFPDRVKEPPALLPDRNSNAYTYIVWLDSDPRKIRVGTGYK